MKSRLLVVLAAAMILGCADKVTRTTTTYDATANEAAVPSVSVAPSGSTVTVTPDQTTTTTRKRVVETEVK